MKKFFNQSLMLGLLTTAMSVAPAFASDHDDGEADLKGRSLNLTDVYAFREDKEATGAGISAAHLVFIVNSNPRSLPQQQYYFSTQARYELHIARVGTSKDVPAKVTEDITLRVEFGAPAVDGKQAITFTTIVDGVSKVYKTKNGGGEIFTTPISAGASPVVSTITADGDDIGIFAGLRKDPFFFDVTAFFQFRLAAAGSSPAAPAGFTGLSGPGPFVYTPNSQGAANDFTANYNANSIAFRIPITFLQNAGETVFDHWASVSVPQ